MYKQTNLYVRKTLENDIVYNIYSSDFNNPWIVILPGIPQYIFKQEFLKSLIRNYNVLSPYYLGSFNSNGIFSIQNIQKIIPESINLINKGELYEYFEKKIYKINTSVAWIFGLSFGGSVLFDFLASQNETILKNIQKLIVSPMFNISKNELSSYWNQKLDFLSSPVYKNIYRGLNKSDIIKWFANIENKEPIKSNGILLYGEQDKYIDKEFYNQKLPNFTKKICTGYSHDIEKLLEYFIKFYL